MSLGDIDADGDLDVVHATSATLEVFPGLGDGGLGPSSAFLSGGLLDDLVVGDFDLDGVVDLGAVSGSNAWIHQLLNQIGEE